MQRTGFSRIGSSSFWLGQLASKLPQTGSFAMLLFSLGSSRAPSHSHATIGHPRVVIISARPAADALHVGTRFRLRISRLWCAAGPKSPRCMTMNLLTCCLKHTRNTSAPVVFAVQKYHNRRVWCWWTHGEYVPSEKLATSKSHSELEDCPASRVPYQHLLSLKHCDASGRISFGASTNTLSLSTLQRKGARETSQNCNTTPGIDLARLQKESDHFHRRRCARGCRHVVFGKLWMFSSLQRDSGLDVSPLLRHRVPISHASKL